MRTISPKMIKNPQFRQSIIPFHLKIIQKASAFLTAIKSWNTSDTSLSNIESNSYSRVYLKNFSRADFIKDVDEEQHFLNCAFSRAKQIDSFDLNEKEFFWYRRRQSLAKSKYYFGYDIDMIEFSNTELFCEEYFGAERWEQLLNEIHAICLHLSKIKQQNIRLRFSKIYHYCGVIHPRPLHYDSFNNSSYKVFMFLGGNITIDQGAYCVIPRSHGKIINKIMTLYNKSLFNKFWGKDTDGSFYNSKTAIKFVDLRDSELIITKQNAIHGDMPAVGREFKKTALVFHLLPATKHQT